MKSNENISPSSSGEKQTYYVRPTNTKNSNTTYEKNKNKSVFYKNPDNTQITTNNTKKKGSCLISGLKLLFCLCFLPFFWIYGIIWFLFIRKKLDDNPEEQRKATNKFAVFSVLSILLFGISIGNDSSSEPVDNIAVVSTEESTEELSSELYSSKAEIENPTETESVDETIEYNTSDIVAESTITESETNILVETVEPETLSDLSHDDIDKREYSTLEEKSTANESVPTSKSVESTSLSCQANTEPSSETTDTALKTEDIPIEPIEIPLEEVPLNTTSSEQINETIPKEPENITPPAETSPTPSNTTIVWVDDTAKRYHKANGCGMDNAYQVTVDEAIAMGKTPCGRCY